MGLFDNFQKKNYLKRIEFIKSLDVKKIGSKSMTISETEELLNLLENKISKHKFILDKNFIMNSRRKTLKSMIEERLLKNNRDINELVSETLFNFFEFVSDEYPGGAGGIMSTCKELGITIKEFDSMDNEYRQKGIICIQERDIILEIIQIIKNYINERGV